MKKPNRVARKGDAAPRRAQSKKPAGALAGAVKVISAGGDEILNARAALGEEIGYCETGPAEQQFLFRKGRRFILATEWAEFYSGAWRRLDVYNTKSYGAAPTSKQRQCMIFRPITRADATAWLRDNLVVNIVPRDFLNEFRAGNLQRQYDELQEKYQRLNALALMQRTASLPVNCIPMPATEEVDYRWMLTTLLGLPADADDDSIFNRQRQVCAAIRV